MAGVQLWWNQGPQRFKVMTGPINFFKNSPSINWHNKISGTEKKKSEDETGLNDEPWVFLLLFYHFRRDPAHSAGWRICFTRNETEWEPRSNRMPESERAAAEKVLASASNTCTPGTNHTPVFYKNSDGFGKREWRKKVACEGRAEERPTSSPGLYSERCVLSPWAVHWGSQGVITHTLKLHDCQKKSPSTLKLKVTFFG